MQFGTGVTLVMLALFAGMVAVATTYMPDARFMPLVVGLPGVALCLLQLVLDLRRADQPDEMPDETTQSLSVPASIRDELRTFGYFAGFIAGVLLFGFLIAVPVLVTLYLWREAEVRPARALLAAMVFTLALHLAFERGLGFSLHPGFVVSGRLTTP